MRSKGWLPCTWRASGGEHRRRPAVGCGGGDTREFRGMARRLERRRCKCSAWPWPRRLRARRGASPSPFQRALRISLHSSSTLDLSLYEIQIGQAAACGPYWILVGLRSLIMGLWVAQSPSADHRRRLCFDLAASLLGAPHQPCLLGYSRPRLKLVRSLSVAASS